jgi:hypothetical protein
MEAQGLRLEMRNVPLTKTIAKQAVYYILEEQMHISET